MAVIFKAGENVLWNSSLPTPDVVINNPKVKVEVNKPSQGSFTVLPGHRLYDQLEKMKTLITIELNNRLIFRGRVIDIQTDLWKQRNVTIESDYAFLMDSVQAPIKGRKTPQQLLSQLITAHNAFCVNEPWKQFTLGRVEITEANTNKEFDITGYNTTSDVISSELLQEYGGIIQTRTENGVTYLDYIEDPFTSPNQTVNSQEIRFGVNLVDYSEQYPISDLFTVLLPLGKDDKTIESENNGSIYLESPEAIAAYGYICHVEQWSHISSARELKETAQVYLNGHARAFPNDMTIRAIDLIYLDPNAEEFKMGDSIRVAVPHLGISEVLYCLAVDYDFQNPENTSYTIGTFIPSDKQKGSTAQSGGGGGGGGGGASETAAKGGKSAKKTGAGLANAEEELEKLEEWKMVIEDEDTGYQAQIDMVADQILTEVTNRENDTSQIIQRVDSISLTVSSHSGQISSITQRADSIELAVAGKVDRSSITITEDSISVGTTTLSVDARAIVTRLQTADLSVGSLTVTGNTTFGNNVTSNGTINAHAITTDSLSVGTMTFRGHSHSIDFDFSDGVVSATIGGAQASDGYDSFDVASTIWFTDAIAEAEERGRASATVKLTGSGWLASGVYTVTKTNQGGTDYVTVELPTFRHTQTQYKESSGTIGFSVYGAGITSSVYSDEVDASTALAYAINNSTVTYTYSNHDYRATVTGPDGTTKLGGWTGDEAYRDGVSDGEDNVGIQGGYYWDGACHVNLTNGKSDDIALPNGTISISGSFVTQSNVHVTASLTIGGKTYYGDTYISR